MDRRRSQASLGFGIAARVPYKVQPHRGTAHWAAKLTDIDVDEICRSNEPQQMIADRFGVHQSRISRIKARKTCYTNDGGGEHG